MWPLALISRTDADWPVGDKLMSSAVSASSLFVNSHRRASFRRLINSERNSFTSRFRERNTRRVCLGDSMIGVVSLSVTSWSRNVLGGFDGRCGEAALFGVVTAGSAFGVVALPEIVCGTVGWRLDAVKLVESVCQKRHNAMLLNPQINSNAASKT